MSDIRNIVVLTGAGISAESGLETFRASDGLWANHSVEDICTPEALARNRPLVLDFYDQRRAALATVEPNPAHEALGRLDRAWRGGLLIVTQNVDDLHERAGTKRLLHMHGELMSSLCESCGARAGFAGAMLDGTQCGACGATDVLRPDIVFFGEMPYEMDMIERELRRADLFVSIGTSGAMCRARAITAPGRSSSTSSRRAAAISSMRAGSGRRASWCPNGWMKCWQVNSPPFQGGAGGGWRAQRAPSAIP
jgi:NAD-dependent deacetylase